MLVDPVADYITLYSSDATQTGGQLVWNVNPEYQFARGPYCLVSLAKAAVLDTDLATNVVVVYKDGQNASSSSNNGAALGVISPSTAATGIHHAYYTGEPVKYLTHARPTTIELNLTQIDKTAITIGQAVFVLKFEYLNTEQAQATTLSTMYT